MNRVTVRGTQGTVRVWFSHCSEIYCSVLFQGDRKTFLPSGINKPGEFLGTTGVIDDLQRGSRQDEEVCLISAKSLTRVIVCSLFLFHKILLLFQILSIIDNLTGRVRFSVEKFVRYSTLRPIKLDYFGQIRFKIAKRCLLNASVTSHR